MMTDNALMYEMKNWFVSKPQLSYIMIGPETRLMMLEITKPNVYTLLMAALSSGRRVNGMKF